MNEIMTREEFLKERNAVCEPDAVAGGDAVFKEQDADTAVMTEENVKLSADGITVSEVVVKGRRNRQYAGLILFITAVIGAMHHISADMKEGYTADFSGMPPLRSYRRLYGA